MWTTRDGHRLELPARIAPTLALRPERWDIRGLLRRNYCGDMRHTVRVTFGELASNARRSGRFHDLQTGRLYPVFHTRVDGRTYHLLTAPRPGARHAIVAIRMGPLQDLAEYVDRPGMQATITWAGPFPAAGFQAGAYPQPGLYTIQQNPAIGTTKYYGQGDPIGREVNQRLTEIQRWGGNLADWQVHIGTMRRAKNMGARLDTVEQVSIRQANQNLGTPRGRSASGNVTTNRSSTEPFRATGAIDIRHRGALPPGLSAPLSAPQTANPGLRQTLTAKQNRLRMRRGTYEYAP